MHDPRAQPSDVSRLSAGSPSAPHRCLRAPAYRNRAWLYRVGTEGPRPQPHSVPRFAPLQPARSAALSAAQLWPCATIHAYPTHRPLGRVMRHAWESLILVATLWALGTPPLEALPSVL